MKDEKIKTTIGIGAIGCIILVILSIVFPNPVIHKIFYCWVVAMLICYVLRVI